MPHYGDGYPWKLFPPVAMNFRFIAFTQQFAAVSF